MTFRRPALPRPSFSLASLRLLSLRTRLLVGLVALALAGLIAADVATYHELRSFLLSRVDATLESDHFQLEQSGLRGVPLDLYVQLGPAVHNPIEFGAGENPPPPRIPNNIASRVPQSANGPDQAAYLTVPAVAGGGQYRLRASYEPGSPYLLIVGTSLKDVNATLHRLLLVELLVTAAVLAGLLGLGLWLIQIGLGPLRSIERTAGAIASGDLSQRVERSEPRTEIGRLGMALNAMLGQIETAFKQRAASEARLRRFVADASHELRTPIAAVRAYSELFRRGAAQRPADLARSMQGIEREAERMSTLVDALLLLARLDEGQALERKPVQLADVAADAVETARAVDPERPLSFHAEPLVVDGDKERLRQVIDNLLGNVRAHTPAGTPAAVSVTRNDGHAIVEVSDEGPGLTDGAAGRIFERFFRADPSRARASGGAGLGLAIVAAVTDAHGGRVSVASEPGHGATFRVELPLRDGA